MDAPTREDFSSYSYSSTTPDVRPASSTKVERDRDETQLRLDFQKVVRRYARRGVLFASQETLAAALKNQYRWITACTVARLIKTDPSLLRIGDYRQRTNGVPYLVLSIPSRLSTARRKAVALRFLLSLVKKRKSLDHKPLNAQKSARYERRYGADHRRKRHFWQAKLMWEGSLPCTRCGKTVYYDQPWHLDHVDGSDTEYAGIAHPWCNTKHQLKAKLASWFKPTFLQPQLADMGGEGCAT